MKIFKFVLLLLFSLALVVRLYHIETLTTFRSDQAIELSGARNILQGKFTLIGIKTSNSELRNGAIMYYLLAPVLFLFSGSPLAGAALQILFQLAALALVFLLTKPHKFWCALSLFFLATSPLLVHFSRQTLLAFYPLFFSTLALFLAVSNFKKFSPLTTLALGVVLGIALQVHYATLALDISALLLGLFLPKKLLLKYFFFLFLGFLLGFSPLLAFELRHEFFNTKMFLALLTSHSVIYPNFHYFPYLWESLTELFGQSWLLVLNFLILALILLRRPHLSPLLKVCLLQIFGSLIFIKLFVHTNTPHYLINAYIPIIILFSWAWSQIKFRLLLILLFLAFLQNVPGFGFRDNHGWTMESGWNLAQVKTASSLISHDVKSGEKYNVAMLVDAENQALPLRYFLAETPVTPLPVEAYPSSSKIYVVKKSDLNLDSVHLWEIDSLGPHSVSRSWPLENNFTLLRLTKTI